MMTKTLLDDLLHIGTLVTNCLLGHLETTWSKLCCPHFLSAVTLSLARGFFGYRFVAYNLHNSTGLENIIICTQGSGITSYGWSRKRHIIKMFDNFNKSFVHQTSTKFPEYTSSRVTSRSSMMSFPLGMFLSCCCRLPPNMKPKSPKKLQKDTERVTQNRVFKSLNS